MRQTSVEQGPNLIPISYAIRRCAGDRSAVEALPLRQRLTRELQSLAGLFSEHVAPEMLYLETKWASLMPFGVTVDLLKDVLPVATTLNAPSLPRRSAHASNCTAEPGTRRDRTPDGVRASCRRVAQASP